MKKLTFLLVIAGATGCITEGNYTSKLAKKSCQRSQECYQAEFDDQYSDVADCVDEVEETFDTAEKCYQEAGCEFDGQATKDCKAAISNATCEDFEDGVDDDSCNKIYDCSTSQEAAVLTCLINS